MNIHKLKLLVALLISMALLLGILCMILDRMPDYNNESTTGSTAATTTPTTAPTTAPTTVPTTAPTTVPTTAPTTVPTTVPETTVLVNQDIGYQAAMLAADQIGKPYRYGGAGPDDFDASGLLQYCFAQYGVSTPRSTAGLSTFGYVVEKDEILPGDAIFFWSKNPGEPEFVAIYIGNGIAVAAMNSSKPVVEFNIHTNYYTEHYVFARRFF